MNIIIVSDTFAPDINGVARTLETLSRGLATLGHRVEVVTTTDAAWEANAAAGVGVRRVRSVRIPGYREVRAGLVGAQWFTRLFDMLKPDVIYVAVETFMGLSAIRAATRAHVPVVSGFHTNFHSYADHYRMPFMKRIAARFMRYVHNRTSRTLTPSRDTARQLRAMGVENVGVLGRGVNTTLFAPEKRDAALRAEWGAGEDTPVAIFVGRIAAEKNLPLAVKAMARITSLNPKARGVFVGGGPKADSLRAKHPQFTHTGPRTGEDLARHYASADIFVFPSLTETYGNVLPEALASGLVTVSFDYAAAHELIWPGQNGFSASCGDEEAFLSATDKALERWNERRLREAARATAMPLSWDSIIAQFEQELMDARPDTPRAPVSSLPLPTADQRA